MTITTKTAVKALFETGDSLDQASFEDMIDSLDPIPRMIMGDKFYAVTTEELQLFYKGIVEHVEPYQNFSFAATGVSDAYRALQRYYKVKLSSTFEHSTFTLNMYNSSNVLVNSVSSNIEIVNAVAQPSSATRVLCIGDSLTANNTAAWVTECNRLLTGSGGSPAGKNFSNIEFIGTQGVGSDLHEGYSGRTIEWHTEVATSPFANGGSLDFANYISTNSFGGLEQVYILLGHNSITNGGAEAVDWADDVAYYKTLIDAILADYPSCKITLVSLQGYGNEGMIGNRKYYELLRATFGHKLAIKSIADDVTYSSNVDWIDLAAQFDIENNQPATATAVNLRATATEQVISDPIHPNANGYDQIADAVYRHFIGTWCQ